MLRVLQRKPKQKGVLEIIAGSAFQMPAAEFEWVQEHYSAAATILEYGSGKSTLFAAGLDGRTIFSVESDAEWVQAMKGHFETAGAAADLRFHHCDIGPTLEWGNPSSTEHWRAFHRYPTTVWDRADFVAPDVVLIDGRFRPGCLITTLLRIERPTVVLFDDYADRPQYHGVEAFVKPVETRGRMARFDLSPWRLPPTELTRILDLYAEIA